MTSIIPKKTEKIFISIQGNIGAGKSTLVKALQKWKCGAKNPNILFLQEPVDDWMNIKDKNGNDMLSLFYRDQSKYSFLFQMMTYISRLELLMDSIEESDADIIISERSLSTDKHIFCQMLYNQGKISDVEFQIYNRWFDRFQKNIPKENIIYLRTSPAITKNRINFRKRKGEIVSMEYLEDCHEYHEKWIEREVSDNLDGVGTKRVLIIDGDMDIEDGSNEQRMLANEVYAFI